MADFQNLDVQGSGGVARVTINRPRVLNALDNQTIRELHACFTALAADATLRGVILTGAGDKAFVAGADITELARQTVLEGKANSRLGQDTLNLIESMDKPVIAAINGYALGGGLELALACTLRTASTMARFGLPEVGLGIIPGYGGTQRLARLVGPGIAREWVITGAHYPAAEAHRIGLVNRVFEPAELLEGTDELLKQILAKGPLAVSMALEAIRRGLELPLEEGLRVEADLFGLISSSADMREGMKAFLEKRRPGFRGN